MSEYPFGEVRRVRYQDGAGNIRTVRAKLIEPDTEEQPWVAVLLEISAPDADSPGAYLALYGWQLTEICDDPPLPLPPTSSHAPWFG